MFEEFRKQTEDAAFSDDDQAETPPGEILHGEAREFFGLTPVQRFIVAFLLLVMTFTLGVLFLLVTAKIALPF